jgi:hypothetical protein
METGSTEPTMKHFVNLHDLWGSRWPAVTEVRRYFIEPREKAWLDARASGDGSLKVVGLFGTDDERPEIEKVKATLYFKADNLHGVMLGHNFWDGRTRKKEEFVSRGDLTRRVEFLTSPEGDKVSLGLFVPFEMAWLAVEDFMNGQGERSKRIDWIDSRDLPADTFPEPGM